MHKTDREEIKKELLEMGSSLNPDSGRGGFTTPESYFDTLPETIQERIYKKKPSTILNTLYAAIRPAYLAVAGVFLLVISLGILFLKDGKENGQLTNTWAQDDLHIEYLSLYANLDPYFFYDMVIESELTNEEILFGINEEVDQEGEEALLDYIYKQVDYHHLDAGTIIPAEND